jgi:hypothetical protein
MERDSEGYKRAKETNLVRMYRRRIPCTCLDKKKEKKEDKMGLCSFGQCCECKPLKRLNVCSECQVARYCCKDCQQNDWPVHQLTCHSLAEQREGEAKKRLSKEESTESMTETESDDYEDHEIKEISRLKVKKTSSMRTLFAV